MKRIYFFVMILLFFGCSVYEVWNGDKKLGLFYVFIDKFGNVLFNNKGVVFV